MGTGEHKRDIMRRKIFIVLACSFLFTACALNREYVKDYGEQMRIMMDYFPELYELYQRGTIVVRDVYFDKSERKYNVIYYYR